MRAIKWHANRGPQTWYAVHSLTNGKNAKRKNLQMHNLVIDVPPGMYADHINHNGLDNRKANLRPVTRTQNVWHRRKFPAPSRSKFKGVDWANDMKRWRARIRVNGKRIYLGSFAKEIDAARAYDKAARQYHGDFAVVNFPDSATEQSSILIATENTESTEYGDDAERKTESRRQKTADSADCAASFGGLAPPFTSKKS